jgi:hypothetical protein
MSLPGLSRQPIVQPGCKTCLAKLSIPPQGRHMMPVKMAYEVTTVLRGFAGRGAT